MPLYRLFQLNAAGVVDQAREVDVPGDDEAVVAARNLDHDYVVEVMRGREQVARVPPGVRLRR